MFYINFRYANMPIETIEECETRKDAKYLLGEYTYGQWDKLQKYWISKRPTKDWRER